MSRLLLVTADDFGVGPDTSRGILDLAARRVVTSTVLLVNSPFAAEGVGLWRRAGGCVELGWHPCLTLDSPVLPPGKVPSLVGEDGKFHALGGFLKRLVRGRIVAAEVEAEFRAQLRRYLDLVGRSPTTVNAHHHIHIFEPVGTALRTVLADLEPRPFVRRVVEPWCTLFRARGARVKRLALSRFGRRAARKQADAGLPGADWLVGVTDPPYVHDPRFFARWLAAAPGRTVELTCHPGYLDATLDGRDGSLADGQLHRRQREYELLRDPAFPEAVKAAGFTLTDAAGIGGQTCGVRLSA